MLPPPTVCKSTTMSTPLPYTCWYRVSSFKSSGRRIRVEVVAAFKPTQATPKETVSGPHTRSQWEVFSFPTGWFERVQADADRIIRAGEAAASKAGLTIVEGRVDPEFRNYATKKPAAVVDYLNFFWLTVEVPFKTGQKKLAASLADEFAKLGTEFSGEMGIELEQNR